MRELEHSPLFMQMSEEDIKQCIACSGAEIREYKKDEMIFSQLDEPMKLYILIEGCVSVCKTTFSGKQMVVVSFEKTGEIFGEVYVFLNKTKYDYDAVVRKTTKVLELPQKYFYHTCGRQCEYHQKLIRNMLSILANKAYYLNRKLQILSSGTLRQKIISFLLENQNDKNVVELSFNREEFADFLHVARPSLSRELIKMQEDALIEVKRNRIKLLDVEALENAL